MTQIRGGIVDSGLKPKALRAFGFPRNDGDGLEIVERTYRHSGKNRKIETGKSGWGKPE